MLLTHRSILAFSVLFLGLLVASCSGFVNDTATFAGTAWALTSINGQQPLAGTVPTLEFGDGTLQGSSGCNSYSGRFTATATELVFSDLARTEMACDAPIMAQEDAFFEVLGSGVTYLRSDDRLGLTNKENGQVVVFTPTQPDSETTP